MICHRCGEPIAYGESHATLYDSAGGPTYMHVVQVTPSGLFKVGFIEEHCPQPSPVAASDPDEQGIG